MEMEMFRQREGRGEKPCFGLFFHFFFGILEMLLDSNSLSSHLPPDDLPSFPFEKCVKELLAALSKYLPNDRMSLVSSEEKEKVFFRWITSNVALLSLLMDISSKKSSSKTLSSCQPFPSISSITLSRYVVAHLKRIFEGANERKEAFLKDPFGFLSRLSAYDDDVAASFLRHTVVISRFLKETFKGDIPMKEGEDQLSKEEKSSLTPSETQVLRVLLSSYVSLLVKRKIFG
jgi:hypothetical protein